MFVLVDQGREFGRIRGYPGDIFFWGLLANLIERLDRGEAHARADVAATRRRARPSPSDPAFLNGSAALLALRPTRSARHHGAKAPSGAKPQREEMP